MSNFLSQSWLINRRHALRAMGAFISLPLLECMIPLHAADKAERSHRTAQAQRIHLSRQWRSFAELSDPDARAKDYQFFPFTEAAGKTPRRYHAHQRHASSRVPLVIITIASRCG